MADTDATTLEMEQGSIPDDRNNCGERLDPFPPGCDNDPAIPGNPNAIYDLKGAQVEPSAAFWDYFPDGKAPLHVVDLERELLPFMHANPIEFGIPNYPRDRALLDWEIAELAWLAAHRDDPGALVGSFADVQAPPPNDLPEDFTNTDRLPISDFIQLDKPPFGAIFNICTRPQFAIDNVNQQHLLRGVRSRVVVKTGRQLARMFESETPGLLHRHALNYLLYKRSELSPNRHARVWMALDVAIYSALNAVWYFKWAAGPGVSFRQRPYEYDRNHSFRVLFDDVVGDKGVGSQCPRRMPCPSPGTPRHPAYGSGHSTFSAAASEVLAYFFPDERKQLEALANNIGTARLWGGVHWRSDHAAGQRIGKAIARLIIQQLECDCVPRFDSAPMRPPTPDELDQLRSDRESDCPCSEDALPPQRRTPFEDCADPRPVF